MAASAAHMHRHAHACARPGRPGRMPRRLTRGGAPSSCAGLGEMSGAGWRQCTLIDYAHAVHVKLSAAGRALLNDMFRHCCCMSGAPTL
eukprot:229507-Chlamydomonas_euryale.AAC.2